MTAEIKGNTLVITIAFDPKGAPSASGKTMVHSSTRGNSPTTVQVDGKTLVIGLNAYTPKG